MTGIISKPYFWRLIFSGIKQSTPIKHQALISSAAYKVCVSDSFLQHRRYSDTTSKKVKSGKYIRAQHDKRAIIECTDNKGQGHLAVAQDDLDIRRPLT